ncbi:MAG: dienelactone hydrolase family protein, partial [Myxococcota bacterium]
MWTVLGLWIGAACVREPPPNAMSPDRIRFDAPATEVWSGDPVRVRLLGLAPGQAVRVVGERSWGYRTRTLYRSEVLLRADPAGIVDLDEPDGLAVFWTMSDTLQPVPEDWPRGGVRFRADVDGDGTFDASAEVSLRRGPRDLEPEMVGDALPGAFFHDPSGEAPGPVVVVLGGSEGGDSTARDLAPRLVARGYGVLGLPYYATGWGDRPSPIPELPSSFHDLPIDVLETARDWLAARDDVDPARIALLGGSKGAELALAGASRIEGFAAVAAFAPSDVLWEGWGAGTTSGESSGWSWRGEPLPFVPYEGMEEEIAKGARRRLRIPHDRGRASAPPATLEAARIRVEDIAAPVLVVGGDA